MYGESGFWMLRSVLSSRDTTDFTVKLYQFLWKNFELSNKILY